MVGVGADDDIDYAIEWSDRGLQQVISLNHISRLVMLDQDMLSDL